MTARGYELDEGVKALKERLRKLELSVARNKPASGITVADGGGFFGGPGAGLTIEDVMALIGAGLSPGAFLTVIGGGKGTVYPMGALGATETVDLSLGNYHWGTLDANCTIGFTGWTAGKDCQITVETIEDGTGGWGVTWAGVTWIGGTTPTPDTAAGTVTHYVFFSRDGGTTIYGALVGSGTSSGGDEMVPYLIEAGETFTVPVKKQALWNAAITVDAGGTLAVDGYLLMVT